MVKKTLFVIVAAITLVYAAEHKLTSNSPDLLTVPQLLNYQGKLTQISGMPVNDSNYSVTFRLFTSATGGTAFWNETQSVQTTAGLFHCLLGSSTPIASIPGDGNCYLEMQVNPSPAMTPRIRLTSSAYAFVARKADTAGYALSANIQYVDSARVAGNSHKLQGKDTLALSAKYVDEGQVNAITNLMLADNAVTSSKIADNTITRNDVSTTFKAPYADTADYAIVVNVPYVDSARIAVKAYDAHKLQGKDTLALSAKYVDEGQGNAITNPMLADNAVTSSKIANNTITRNDVSTTFKAPYADTADYAIVVNVPYVDSARIAGNSHKLQGKDTIALSAKYVDEGQINAITNPMLADNAVTSSKIADNTITRNDVSTTFKAPYADTADYAIVVNVPYVDSARIAVKAYDAHKVQGKDTLALSAKYVDEGQGNAITNPMLADNAVTSSKIADNTITRNDVSTTFKAPYADTADFAIVVNVPYVDSARIAVKAYDAHKLQGKDTLALSAKYVDEGQVNAITNLMLADNAVTSSKIADNTITRNDVSTTFKAPYADTADYAIVVNVPYVDSARIAVKAYDAHKLQGKDTLALSAKYVDEGQVNAITNPMLADNAVTSSKIADNTITRNDVSTTFKAPYADTADYAIVVNVPYVDSARIAVNAYALEGNNLSALDTRYVNTGETDAISNTMIQDNAVTSAKIADGTILGDDIAVPLNLEGSVNWPNGIVHIKNRTTGRGIVIDSVGFGGVHIGYAFADGFNVGYAGQSGLSIDTVGGSAIRVIVTPFDAIGVDEAGFAALYAMHAGTGVQIDSSESDGIYAYGNFSGGRLIASNPQGIGLIAHAYNNTSTDTAIQAYGSGYATGGWYTGGLLDNKSAPCLISSELGIVTSGTATLSDGEAVINFDPLFADNIRTDIPIRITVTPKGRPAGFLYVAESRANGFRVALEAIPGLEKNGTDITFDWIAVGTLKDYQTSPDAQTQWQQMIKERDAQREARKQANRK